MSLHQFYTAPEACQLYQPLSSMCSTLLQQMVCPHLVFFSVAHHRLHLDSGSMTAHNIKLMAFQSNHQIKDRLDLVSTLQSLLPRPSFFRSVSFAKGYFPILSCLHFGCCDPSPHSKNLTQPVCATVDHFMAPPLPQ